MQQYHYYFVLHRCTMLSVAKIVEHVFALYTRESSYAEKIKTKKVIVYRLLGERRLAAAVLVVGIV